IASANSSSLMVVATAENGHIFMNYCSGCGGATSMGSWSGWFDESNDGTTTVLEPAVVAGEDGASVARVNDGSLVMFALNTLDGQLYYRGLANIAGPWTRIASNDANGRGLFGWNVGLASGGAQGNVVEVFAVGQDLHLQETSFTWAP